MILFDLNANLIEMIANELGTDVGKFDAIELHSQRVDPEYGLDTKEQIWLTFNLDSGVDFSQKNIRPYVCALSADAFSFEGKELKNYPSCLKNELFHKDAEYLSFGGLVSKKQPLKTLPKNLHYFENVKYLIAASAGLVELPESIGKMKSLKKLNLTDNDLEELPDSIGGLKNLETLDLYDNKLKVLPDSIGDLMNLRKLNLYNNKLKRLPESLKKLEKLRHIELQKNPVLSDVKEDFTQFAKANKIHIFFKTYP